MPRHLAFATVLALAGAIYFLVGSVTILMVRDGLGGDDPALRWIFIGVICIEFAVSALIGISLSKRFSRGVFPIAWTDAAVIALTIACPPALAVLLWWYMGVRKSILPNLERRPPVVP
ncbi:MAG: hypothetical protein ACYTGZ_05775 [Planctomycetota bacterium]|jgi:hypothetical protein